MPVYTMSWMPHTSHSQRHKGAVPARNQRLRLFPKMHPGSEVSRRQSTRRERRAAPATRGKGKRGATGQETQSRRQVGSGAFSRNSSTPKRPQRTRPLGNQDVSRMLPNATPGALAYFRALVLVRTRLLLPMPRTRLGRS